MRDWSNLAAIVTRRTYARKDTGKLENWTQIIERAVEGNVRGHDVPEQEIKDLLRFGIERKAIPAGRGLWFSGSPAHALIGGAALNNCWYLNSSNWENFVRAQDLLMLGGGVGMSVEHRFTSKLPKVKKDIQIVHKPTKDADFIVPDSREGWCKLTKRVLESYFVTGKSFSYSTYCLRGSGELIKGFGGLASGPFPLIQFVTNLSNILSARAGNHIRPIDAADIITCTGEMVVSGNVRRSAIIILGDCWDKEYLKAKRWDLGLLPSYRSCANYSVVCDDYEDLHPLFWKTFEQGEAFGIINRKAIQKFGRLGEYKTDTAEGVNPSLRAGTRVWTDGGIFPIEELEGKSFKVRNLYGQESEAICRLSGRRKRLWKIRLTGRIEYFATEEHKWPVFSATGVKKVETSELSRGYWIARCTPKTSITSGEQGSYEDGFIIGWNLGDGWITERENGRQIGFIVSKDDKKCGAIHLRIQKYLREKCGWKGSFEDKDEINVSNNRLKNIFSSFGVQNKVEGLPKCVWSSASEAFRRGLIDGLFSSDGHVDENSVCLTTAHEKLARDISDLLGFYGINNSVPYRKMEKVSFPNGKNYYKTYEGYKVDVQGTAVTKFSDVFKLSHTKKQKKIDAIPRKEGRIFPALRVQSVEPTDLYEDVWDISVRDETHCFQLAHLITGNCAEATLEPNEPCNLQEIALPNFDSEEEFIRAAVLMHRYGKRVTMERYHHEEIQEVINRNRRVGTGITGCLASPLFTPSILDRAYEAIQKENVKYSKELGIPKSIRTTVVKPSGTVSKVLDMSGYEGIHAAYSRYIIQRIRFAANDSLIPLLRAAGHYIEPVKKLDGTLDHGTLVVDFYVEAPEGSPVADEDWDTWKQLDVYKMAQKHWSDQSVSVSVYYKKNEIGKIKDWIRDNLKETKSISFLCHSDHGFVQAPKEKITKEQFEQLSEKIKPIDVDRIDEGSGLDGLECENGTCPVK